MRETMKLYGQDIASRLLIGTALYPSPAVMEEAIRASGLGGDRVLDVEGDHLQDCTLAHGTPIVGHSAAFGRLRRASAAGMRGPLQV